MQSTSGATRLFCCYPISNHHIHLHLPHKRTIIPSSPSKTQTQTQTHLRNNCSFTLTATNSCSEDQERKNNTHPRNHNHTFLEELYSSFDTNTFTNQTQRTPNQEEEEEAEKSEVVSTNMWWADMKAALGQVFNLEGIVCSAAVVVRDRHLALPHVAVPDIRYIDWGELRKRGFRGVVFDKDNTITAPYSLTLWGPLGSSLERCKSVFGNDIAVFSNSAGLLQYDPDGSKARALERAIGIKVIRHRVMKPSGRADEIEKHFGCASSLLIMVGDRHFTDIVFGNRNGFLTILTEPLTLADEPFIVKQVRKLEASLVNRWYRRGLKPTDHSLLPDPLQCVKDPPPL